MKNCMTKNLKLYPRDCACVALSSSAFFFVLKVSIYLRSTVNNEKLKWLRDVEVLVELSFRT